MSTMSTETNSKLGVCLALTGAISRSRTVEDIYTAALDALDVGLDVPRSAILLFDRDGVMRFTAHRGLSTTYRAAVEGHSPWTPDTPDAQPLVVADVRREPTLQAFLPTIEAEGIAAMAFIPLVSLGRVIGKFMLYYPAPHELTPDETAALRRRGGSSRVRCRADARRRARASERRAAALRARCGVDGHVGLGSHDAARHVVRQPRAPARTSAEGTFDGTFS